MAFPSLIERAKSYVKSRAIWVAAGKPMRSDERILEIYTNFCQPCEHYKTTGYACDICGCFINKGNLANKICWATTRCPDNDPKWIEDIDISNLNVEQEKMIVLTAEERALLTPEKAIQERPELLEEPHTIAETPPEPPAAPAPGGCGCGR